MGTFLFIKVAPSFITQQKKGWYSWLYSLAGTIKTREISAKAVSAKRKLKKNRPSSLV